MSKEIPTIGKVWLFIMTVLATIGVVTNFAASGQGIEYIISGFACTAELIGMIFLLKGKGLPYLCLYAAGYVVNAVLVAMIQNSINAAWLVGFIIGVCINIGLTYLAVKNTIRKPETK